MKTIAKTKKLKTLGYLFLSCLTLLGMSADSYIWVMPKANALTQPQTPTVPICGARNNADVEQYTGPALPSPAYVNEIEPGGNNGINSYMYWPGSSGQDPRWYIDQAVTTQSITFFIYDATTDALINNFTISIPSALQGQATQSSFAVDPSGNIYIGTYAPGGNGGTISQWLWSPGDTSATEGWSVKTPGLLVGAVYGYTDSSGVYRIAGVTGNPTASDIYAAAYSDTYNATDGTYMGTNNLIGNGVQPAYAHNNDLVSVDTNSGSVYIWNSTATNELFYMSAGTNSWMLPNGANELANGDIVTVSYIGDLSAIFSPTGVLLGKIYGNTYAGNPLDVINGGPVQVINGRIYYVAENPYSTPNKLTYFTTTTEADYLASPQGAPFSLGIGAGLSTNAAYNYFSYGTTPQVNLNFNQWWQGVATDYTGSYTVSSLNQVINGQTGTSQSFSIPGSLSDYTNSTTAVPLTLPPATPGVYAVNVQLLQSGTVVGADCLTYTVGAANDSFNPATLPSGADTQGIALAAAFGQKLYRSTYNLDACYPGVTDPTSTTTLNCPSSMISDIQSAATLAAQDGVTYEIQLGTGTTFDQNAVSNGQWQRLVGLMVAEFPSVTDWECWNEPDNNSFSSAASYVTTALEPCYNAVKGVSASDNVIGISNDNYSVSNYQSYVSAGALNYLNIVAVHAYTGFNRSFEEQGMIIPSIYSPSETGSLQSLQTYLKSVGYSGPIYDTESGFWNNTPSMPYNYYDQGDKLVRKMILEQSIGMDWNSNFFNIGGYEVNGAYWELLGGADNVLTPGGLAAINYTANLGGRSFQTWLPTGVPHTYAALFGPSSTSPNDVVAVWSDDYNVSIVPSLSGGGSINVTSEYGVSSSLNYQATLNLSGQVQYLSVPSGQSISIAPYESYAVNYASTAAGASAVASSSYACGSTTLNPNKVLSGIDDAEGNNSEDCNGPIWTASESDSNPTLTINLSTPETLDRIYISSYSIGSILTGLRNYQVEVGNGSGLTTVANISNQWYNRNNLISFTPQTVSQIVITGMQINYSGYGNGLPPGFWSSSFPDLTSIYDVEAYAPGTGATIPPTNNLSLPDMINGYTHSYAPLDVVAQDSSGSGIKGIDLYIDGLLNNSVSSSSYDFTLDTLKMTDGNHNLTVMTSDNNGYTTTTPLPIIVNNGDLNSDGKVNLSDLIILAQNYGRAGSFSYSQGNITDSNSTTTPQVGLSDLIILAQNYGWVASP